MVGVELMSRYLTKQKTNRKLWPLTALRFTSGGMAPEFSALYIVSHFGQRLKNIVTQNIANSDSNPIKIRRNK